MADLASHDVREAMIEALMKELDIRTHPTTKPFFDHVKEETVAKLHTFYSRHALAVLEAAFTVRHAVEQYESIMGPFEETAARENAYQFIRSLHPDATGESAPGYAEIRPILGALRGFEDDGLSIVLGNLAVVTACEILDDNHFKALEERLFPDLVNG